MVHTLPDHTTKYRMATVFGNLDDAELAARLGSINTFDRRGTTVWMDDFESSLLKWAKVESGGGSAVTLQSEFANRGSQAIKLYTGDGANDYASITRRFPLPVNTKLGAEIHFITPDPNGHILLYVAIYTGTYRYVIQLDYDFTNTRLYIIKGNGAEVYIGDPLVLPYYTNLFHVMKLVFDYEAEYHVRALCDNVEYDISAYQFQRNANATAPHMYVELRLGNGTATNVTAYIDDFILTQNE